MLGYAVSQGFLVALLWNALTHQLLQSHLQGDYLEAIQFQFYNLGYSHPPTLWNFLLSGGGIDGDGGVITYLGNGVFSLFIEGVFAVSGAALGAAASYRANNTGSQEAGPAAQSNRAWLSTRPIGLVFLSLLLALLTWLGFAALQNAWFDSLPLSLSVLGGSFMGPAFVLWLLGFLAMLASAFVSLRPNPALPEAHAPLR